MTLALQNALGLEAQSARLDDVWFAGSEPGTLRWQGTASFDDLDPVAASGTLQRAQELLGEDVQVLVPASGRVVLRIRSALVVVGEDAAAAAVAGGAR